MAMIRRGSLIRQRTAALSAKFNIQKLSLKPTERKTPIPNEEGKSNSWFQELTIHLLEVPFADSSSAEIEPAVFCLS